jgi:hypothetical protein
MAASAVTPGLAKGVLRPKFLERFVALEGKVSYAFGSGCPKSFIVARTRLLGPTSDKGHIVPASDSVIKAQAAEH